MPCLLIGTFWECLSRDRRDGAAFASAQLGGRFVDPSTQQARWQYRAWLRMKASY